MDLKKYIISLTKKTLNNQFKRRILIKEKDVLGIIQKLEILRPLGKKISLSLIIYSKRIIFKILEILTD
jgi:hypothetical protein